VLSRGDAMTNSAAETRELGEQFLKSIDKAHVGAAASKLFFASVGEIVTIFSRSPLHKHYSLADIEWMVAPAVLSGQFYVVEAAHKEHGFRTPIAVVTWAFVSEEVDRRLQIDLTRQIRLKPDEWKSGDIGWIIDLVGVPTGVRQSLAWLKGGPFKERKAKSIVRDSKGQTRVELIEVLAT
jgi:hemolysin-activating ACP:hemolysin acyltransferase